MSGEFEQVTEQEFLDWRHEVVGVVNTGWDPDPEGYVDDVYVNSENETLGWIRIIDDTGDVLYYLKKDK